MTVADQRAPAAAPTVSVVIPAYNVAAYLGKSVGSALSQEVDVEVVVVDDCSTDSTWDEVRRLEADPRVRAFRLPVNGGPSAARNKGLDEARGEWVAFLDADDWFAPGRLAYLLEIANAAGADAVTDDLFLINEGADRPWATIYQITGWTQAEEGRIISPAEMCRRDWILQPMFRTAWLRAHGLRFHTVRHSAGEDFEFYMNALLCGVKWVAARRAMYFYMARPGQLTRRRSIAEGLIESAEAMARDERISGDSQLARAFAERTERIRSAQWVGLLADAVRERSWLRAAGMVVKSPRRLADAAAAFRRRRWIGGLLRRGEAAE
ncbi:MAG TPA: glycosyltransferase family 2 protein [Allosphingosinicella sp.]|jgi:succinoglycan biosynthesis protein ExoO|nr:glycosyltransferase family 2 protein [Allosphingosinicella sp.]